MQDISLYIIQAGKGKVPKGWFRKQTINIQRLYYIKSGDGYMIDDKRNQIPFKPRHIYLFPNNYNQEFVTDPDDAIDHIYIDFTTTPPIIAKEPLVYPVGNGSGLIRMVELFDRLLVERCMDPAHIVEPPSFFGEISNAENGSYEEYKQLLHLLTRSLLVMLSYQKDIPYSTDRVVSAALEYMRLHYSEKIDTEVIARQFGCNVHHFIRRFHSVMGITPYAYLRHLRLTQALDLISGGASLATAAEQVGYESASSLSRALRDIRDPKA